MSKTTKITLSDTAHGGSYQMGINGRTFSIPTGSEVEVDEGVLDALRNSGADFSISGHGDGSNNAVSVIRADPPLTGGPKVVAGKGDNSERSSFSLGVKDNAELGEGEGSLPTGGVANADDPSQTDYSHDTGGASAPSPGSRDTIATSAQPQAAHHRAAAKKAPAKK